MSVVKSKLIQREIYQKIIVKYIQNMDHINNTEYQDILNEIFNNLGYETNTEPFYIKYKKIKPKIKHTNTIQKKKAIQIWNKLFLEINKK